MSLELTADDKAALLATARESIEARLLGRPPRWPSGGPALDSRLGAFVTLHKRSSYGRRLLRGCIGRMSADKALVLTVRDMALAAAFGPCARPCHVLRRPYGRLSGTSL